MSVKNSVKTPLTLDQGDKSRFVVDRFNGIVVHYGFWFAEIKH